MTAAELSREILADSPFIYAPLDDARFSAATSVRNLGSLGTAGTPTAGDWLRTEGIDAQSTALFAERANGPDISWPDNAVYDSTSITWEFWARLKRDLQDTYLISRQSHMRYQINANGTLMYTDANSSPSVAYTTTRAMPAFNGKWHQYVLVWDETIGQLFYFDGEHVDTNANAVVQGTSTSTLYIGRRPTSSPTNPLDGAMAHFAAFPSALSFARIRAHWLAGSRRWSA